MYGSMVVYTDMLMDIWVCIRRYKKVHGCIYGWMDGYMDAYMDAWIHIRMDIWMYGWIYGWISGCMDGYLARFSTFTYQNSYALGSAINWRNECRGASRLGLGSPAGATSML